MADSTQRIAESLAKAMQAETEGRHFYLMAAKSTQDSQGQEAFQQLADEELDHFHFLKAQYKSFLENGKPSASAELGPKRFKPGHPIFSQGIQERIGQAHYEMTALSVGMQLELSAVSFYESEAQKAEDPKVKAFFQKLADWEKGHLAALQAEIESLRTDYWDRGGFSPF